jgi:peptide subunit release factor 1 (eRF1)
MSQKTFVCDDCGLKFNFEDISVNEVSICKLCNDEEDEAKQKSFFGKSLEKQSDYEVQTEHWDDDRKITDF